jgi:beta-phosphoglucomutase
MGFKACIFDLDGVITDTAKYHYESWKKVADHFGYRLTPKQNEKLKGVSRKESLNKILHWAGVRISEAEKQTWLSDKNKWYLSAIDSMERDEIFPGFVEFAARLQHHRISIGLGSASKNAIRVLDKLHLVTLFDAVVDGNMVEESKPDPEVFLKAAVKLNVKPEECVVVEDSAVGVEAAIAGGMKVVGFGEQTFEGTHLHLTDWSSATFDQFNRLF